MFAFMGMKMYLTLFFSFALSISAHDCSFDKRDVKVPNSTNSTVQIDCVWKRSAVSGSTGFIFGVIVYDPIAKCHMMSTGVLATSSAFKESQCIRSSAFEDWCNKYLLNATEVTEANNQITTSVKIQVQSLLHHNLTYNRTTVILFYWKPKFYGQDNNKGGSQCIMQVDSGPSGKSVEPNSTGTTIATPIEATNSTASPISTISTTRSKSDVASKRGTTENLAIILPVVLLVMMLIGIIIVVWYCKKTGRCSQVRSASSVLANPVTYCEPNNENGTTEV